MIDEIYCAKRVEYSQGKFIGVTKEGIPAKTVLLFLIQSLQCKYRDVVMLLPLNGLNSEDLRGHFEEVMKELNKICTIQCLSLDNAPANR